MSTVTKRWLLSFTVMAFVFFALDAVWITGVARGMYDRLIPHLLAETIHPAPAALFYLGYLVGAVQLAVRPGATRRTWLQRLRDGALLGALAYGTWGFTAASVLTGFPVGLALADCAWGAALTAVATGAAGLAIDKVVPADA